MARIFRICTKCNHPDVTVRKRGEVYGVLCAECHADLLAAEAVDAPDDTREAEPEVRVWTPRETGILTYNPFRNVSRQQS